MTNPYRQPDDLESPQQPDPDGGYGGHRHSWMMMICCIPMIIIAIAIALVATGVASSGFLLAAIGCTAMMFLMMRGMSGGGHS